MTRAIPAKKSRKTASSADPIIVVGNGMVSHRFCRLFREADKTTPLIVFGKEPDPAYDRVNLTKRVTLSDRTALYLDDPEWYVKNKIDLHLGESVDQINATAKTVTTSDRFTLRYSNLVLASGSSAWLPPIRGAQSRSVFLYRTLVDIEYICSTAAGSRSAVVIGGGLLGLEAAQALKELGLTVHVIEIADYLMPQQLDAAGGIALKDEISNSGIFVRTRCQTEKIDDADGQKELLFSDGTTLRCDFIVISVGIRPAADYLEGSTIQRSPQGAVQVNEKLETNNPNVFAIGECASFEGSVYGLVAPGYQMAETLAARLTGTKRLFKKPDLSTRLKVMDVHVAALGDYHQADHTTEALVFHKESGRATCYRKLIHRKRRITGIIAVGPWDALPVVQNAMELNRRISWKQLRHFEETGDLAAPSNAPAVLNWSPDTQVCNCMMVKKSTLTEAIQSGCKTVDQLSKCTLAGTVCGSCQPILSDLVGLPSIPMRIPLSARIVICCSIFALFSVTATVFAGPLAYADSIEIYWYKVDQLWRDSVLKQISGYTLLVLCLMALWLSVQKRFAALKIGNYSMWRATHTATGLLTLALLFLHTGFHLGAHFNSWLMLTFALLNLLGGISGMFSGLESKTDVGIGIMSRRLKPIATWAHILLFWPLPTLVLFHIISVYYW